MSQVTAGQSLVDVALQELGTVEALFDLADAAGLAITDPLTPGQVLSVPASPAAQPRIVSYFSSRAQRLNTAAPPALPAARFYDFNQTDFSPPDFS